MINKAGMRIFLKDQVIYIFTLARVEKAPPVVDQCIAKHSEAVEDKVLGGDILRALQDFGRSVAYEEVMARQNPILAATGYKSEAKFNKGLGSVSVSFFADNKLFDLVPWRSQGRNSLPVTEERQQLPPDASATAIGEQALKLLRRSREINSAL